MEDKKLKGLFEYVSSTHSGVDFENTIIETVEENIFIYDNIYAGAGAGLGDINNDGLLDIYFCGNQVGDRLYLNKGGFEFEDITESSGIADVDQGWSSSISMADVNQDGLLDLFVTKELYDDKPDYRRDKLYINQGNSTFREMAQEWGLGDTLRSRGAVFFDYDLDDDLDVFILHQPPNPGIYSSYRPLSDDGRLLDEQYAPRLYENRDGRFEDVSERAKVLNPGFANAVAVADINGDGYSDIVVANDFEAPDKLYLNQRNGQFKNIANEAFLHTSFYSMGLDIADINNDKLLDVYVVDMVAQDNFRIKSNMSGMEPAKFWRIVDKNWNYQYMYNVLQLNNGNNTFSDIAKLGNVSSTDWSWSPLIADFDNDGLKDIFVSNGLLRDIRNTDADKAIKRFIHEKIQSHLSQHAQLEDVEIWDIVDFRELTELYPSNKIQNKFYQNTGDFGFEDVSTRWGGERTGFSNGSAYGDLDNDGDLDLVVNNVNEQAFVMQNMSRNNFLRIKLSSSKHVPLFGTKIAISYNNGQGQFVETTNVRGMYSSSEDIVHFGLKDSEKIDEVRITWPQGGITTLKNVKANKLIHVEYEKAEIETAPSSSPKPILFEEGHLAGVEFEHEENPFDDFEKQLLMPHKLSQLGPALAVADINNDGMEDFYVGGAFDQSPEMYIQQANGLFAKVHEGFWNKEAPYEDVDALFVDINNDDYLDLYVVSGGNAYAQGDFHYVDRLYINNRDGSFSKGAILGAERASGAIARAFDYDQDGDADLFVGGRHTPHQYPVACSSMLLINENGQLQNKTSTLAPDLLEIGMVTDALWSDVDGDDIVELMVVGEWMPITVFKSQEGHLRKEQMHGLENSSGWWYSIEQGDFDRDGDIDFIAGNLGLNYKYKTSAEQPFDVYYHDFDQNGHPDIVLGYYNDLTHYPLRGFSCSSQQIPQLKKEIREYDVFASMDIEEIYGEEPLGQALHYEAVTFASSYVENIGNGQFELKALPRRAQFSSINDMAVGDFNSDGNLDLLGVENFFHSEVETPRNDAGTGLVLLGDGKGHFEAIAANKSGFFVNSDAKKVDLIKIQKSTGFILSNNNGQLQYFKSIYDRIGD